MYINGREKWKGITPNEDGYAVCEKCGCNQIKMTNHFDGRDFYGNGGHCVECGNIIQIMYKRNGGLWEE